MEYQRHFAIKSAFCQTALVENLAKVKFIYLTSDVIQGHLTQFITLDADFLQILHGGMG